MEGMVDNILKLFVSDADFQKLFSEQETVCLPHYELLMERAARKFSKKQLPAFQKALDPLTERYLAALTEDWELSRVARYKSQDMHDNRYFAHNSPTYGTPFRMLRAFGLSYRTAGENIAMGYAAPAAVVAGWMNSEGHRANILSSAYTKIGVGYVADGHYWTQQFIG